MPRVLRFTLIGCGGLIVLVGMVGALIGGDTEPSSPPERAEQDEGVEGGGKEPEAKKPLEGEKAKKPEEERIEIPDSVDYRVVGQTGDDERGFWVRTWEVETADDSLGALCLIGQDAVLDAGEGWDAVRVLSESGEAMAPITDAAPQEYPGFERCPGPGNVFVSR